MKNQLLFGAIAVSAMTIGSTMIAPDANAMTFSFGNIAGGSTVGDSIANQFSFDVDDLGSGDVLFTVKNAGTYNPAFIREIYFDKGNTGSILGTFVSFGPSSAGVSYNVGATPPNLPQATNISFTSDFAADPNGQGANQGGIDAGEFLGIKFTGANYSAIIASLLSAPATNQLRLGIHVADVACVGSECDSDSYVSGPPTEVPTPAAVLPILGGLFGAASRRKKGESTEA